MKRALEQDQEPSVASSSSSSSSTSSSFGTKRKYDDCAICRGRLDDKCIACVVAPLPPAPAPGGPVVQPRICQGFVANAVCDHTFHTECISRWLETRRCCPLCNASWVFPWGLTLAQRASVRCIDDETKIADLAASTSTLNLDPAIFEVLHQGVRVHGPPRQGNTLPPLAQRLLAQTFAHHLTVAELEQLLASKRPSEPGSKS